VWWFGFPALRDIDQFSDLEAPENPS